MNFDEVETFLSVVHHGNIARAAAELCIGQGTASARIQHLERELGIQLFFRQKGIKTVTLTPEGEHFLVIARQWLSLRQQADQIKNLTFFKELRVAAVDTLNQFHFIKLYKNFMTANPEIRFFLQTEHSTEIHQLIEKQQIDLGFAFTLHKSPNVIATPLFEEIPVIVYHKDCPYHQTHNLSDLCAKNEIYQTYGSDYDLWHHRYFPDAEDRKISIGTFSMLPHFIKIPETWSILPQSHANIMLQRDDSLAFRFITDDPPPTRIAYMLEYKYPKPWTRDIIHLFLEDILEMIHHNPAMKLLYHI